MFEETTVNVESSVGSIIKSPIGAEAFHFPSFLMIMAVKKLECWALSANSDKAFLEAVANISLLHHENLIELVGYSIENGQHLLVYEYYGNGNLENILHVGDDIS